MTYMNKLLGLQNMIVQ